MGKIFHRVKILVKYDVSIESLRKYHNQGWHFFIRTVGERRYITIRRKGKEKSLGPYNDDILRAIEEIDGRVAREGQAGGLPNKPGSPRSLAQARVVNEREGRFLKTIEELTRYMLSFKHRNCLQVGVDGFCGY